jgi:thymidylate kinase
VCGGFAQLAEQQGWCRIDAGQPLEDVSRALQDSIRAHVSGAQADG